MYFFDPARSYCGRNQDIYTTVCVRKVANDWEVVSNKIVQKTRMNIFSSQIEDSVGETRKYKTVCIGKIDVGCEVARYSDSKNSPDVFFLTQLEASVLVWEKPENI